VSGIELDRLVEIGNRAIEFSLPDEVGAAVDVEDCELASFVGAANRLAGAKNSGATLSKAGQSF
jgi:hypothetical protein